MSVTTEWVNLPSGAHVSVTVWDGAEPTYNLADHKGDVSFTSKGFKALSIEDQSSLKEGLKKAQAFHKKKRKALVKSIIAIDKVWREDMIRYEATKEPYLLITKGLGGISAYQAKDCAGPCYQEHQFGKSTGVTIYDTRLKCYYGQLVDGGIVLDKSEALNKNPGLAIKSPMLDTHLDKTSKFKDVMEGKDTFLLNVLAKPEHFGAVAGMALLELDKPATEEVVGGYDSVPLLTYCQWWMKNGARAGRRDGNQVKWHDGTVEEIVSEDFRWKQE